MDLTHKIVYGSNILALQYANQNNAQIILNNLRFPEDFSPPYIKEAWTLLYTKLMLDGKTIGGDTVKNTRVGEDFIYVVSGGNVVNQLKYDILYIFSDENIIGLPLTIEETMEYDIVDYMKPVFLKTPQYFRLKTGDDFVSEIYISKRFSTDSAKISVISTLTKDQLYEFDYSDTMAKFKTEDILKEKNFIGTMTGRIRKPVTLETVERKVYKRMDKYKSTEKIKFIYGD